MAIYRKVDVSFWQDSFVMDLTPEEKYFYLYLMTNTKTSQCGIYELPKRLMCFETGYNLETIDKLISRFVEYKKILYDDETNEIFLLNWIRFNWSNSEKVITRVIDELKALKNQEYAALYCKQCKEYGYSIDTLCIPERQEEETKEEEETEEQTKKETKEKEDIHQQFVDGYHAICPSLPKVMRITDSRKRAIKARIKDDGLDTIKTVLEKTEASDFLTGRSGDFKATFDWILKPANFIKILEGNYDNRKPKNKEPLGGRVNVSAIEEYERLKNEGQL